MKPRLNNWIIPREGLPSVHDRQLRARAASSELHDATIPCSESIAAFPEGWDLGYLEETRTSEWAWGPESEVLARKIHCMVGLHHNTQLDLKHKDGVILRKTGR